MTDIGVLDAPTLIFGGPYSNLQATEALLAEARSLRIPSHNIICTGDVVAYCAEPQATVDAVRKAGIHVVMGNCEESLGQDRDDCGCGFAEGSACDLLSQQWFAFSRQALDDDAKQWMAALPRRLDFAMSGRHLAVIHGGGTEIERFIFPSTAKEEKHREIENLAVDGVIGGHSGLPFCEDIGGRLWHNAGVIGMPANDGTPRTWYSVLTPRPDGIEIAVHALTYDQGGAAERMQAEGLPDAYRKSLETGLWPNMDILPPKERAQQGHALKVEPFIWT